jgi:nucleoid DNA-binding protein
MKFRAMSKEKINTNQLAESIAAATGQNRKIAEDFLKFMTLSIEEGLVNKEQVKIKGLGTFKLVWNEPRKSVDVNTGESIVIAGYNKVSFVPEPALKEEINEPFAHLEPVLLETGITVESGIPKEVAVKPLDVLADQANEIKDILTEINAIGAPGEPVITKVEQVEHEATKSEEIEPEVTDSEVTEPEVAEINSISSEVKPEITSVLQQEEPVAAKKRNFIFPMLFIGMIIGGALVYILSYYQILPDVGIISRPEVAVNELISVTDDSLLISAEDTIKGAQSVQQEPVDSLQLLFDEERVYTEFIASEKVIQGSRLTRISQRHYGAKEFWVFIYEANRDILPNPESVVPGLTLRIPKLNPVLADLNNPRCKEYLLELEKKYAKK